MKCERVSVVVSLLLGCRVFSFACCWALVGLLLGCGVFLAMQFCHTPGNGRKWGDGV